MGGKWRSCVITSYSIHYTKLYDKGASISQLARSGHLRLLVTNTDEMRKNIVGHQLPGLDPDIVFPIPTGRDPLRTAPEAVSLPKHTTGLNLGFVGKMQVQKGMALIAELSQRLPGHDFHLIGGDEAQIQEWREKMPGPHVHFHGYVPQAEVGRYICALDVCLLPNVPHHENPSGILYSSPMKA